MCCCWLILINGFHFNEKYLIGKRVLEQKPREMTSPNCNLISYSTHVASNFIMRGIKKIHRKVLFIIFTKIFHNIIITIHKHIDHIWLKFLTSFFVLLQFLTKSSAKLRRWSAHCLQVQNRCWRHAHCQALCLAKFLFLQNVQYFYANTQTYSISTQYLLCNICYIILSLKTNKKICPASTTLPCHGNRIGKTPVLK